MFPSVRSRLGSERSAADIVAASSRQYEGPVMPHSMTTNVATGGIAIASQPGPVPNPAARRASPRFEPVPAAWPTATGCGLGEVTARCLSVWASRSGQADPVRAGRCNL